MTKVSLQGKIAEWLIIGVFTAVIFLSPLLMVLHPDTSDFSRTEKRKLAPFPELSTAYENIGKIPREFDMYIGDHFGLREWYINRYQREMRKRFGSSGTEAVITGKNNWFYFASESQMRDLEGHGYVSAGDLESIRSVLSSRKKWLENRGIAYLFFTPPNKQSIYPEFLPDSYQKTLAATRLDTLVSFLDKGDGKLLLDLREGLLKKKELYRLYNRTDTHWNALGASAAFEYVAEELEGLFPGIRFDHAYKFSGTWIKGFRGDLAIMADLQDSVAEETPLVRGIPYCANKKPFKGQDALDKRNSTLRPYVTRCGQNRLKAIVYYDSFIEAMEPLVSASFGEVLYVRGSFEQEPAELLIEEFKPDIVLEELVERDVWLLLKQKDEESERRQGRR